MAEVFIKDDDDGWGFTSIKGHLRIMLMNLDKDGSDPQLICQPFPNDKERETGLRMSLPEFRDAIVSSNSFDRIVPQIVEAKRNSIQGETLTPEQEWLAEADPVDLVQKVRSEASTLGKLFRELADRLDQEVTQFDAWVEQEASSLDQDMPPFMMRSGGNTYVRRTGQLPPRQLSTYMY